MSKVAIFQELCEILRDVAGNEIADTAIKKIIRHFGGERIYIPAREDIKAQPGDTPQTLIVKGVSKTTAYRITKRYRI